MTARKSGNFRVFELSSLASYLYITTEKLNVMNIRTLVAVSMAWFSIAGGAHATTYSWPENPNDTVITEHPDGVAVTQSPEDETLLDVARRFNLGQAEVVRLNPDLDRWHVKKGEIVSLPNRRILPDSPRKGITLNIAEYRMYYYPPAAPGMPPVIKSFAHGIGRQDWQTPLGQTKVAKKVKDPSWHPPESIRREHAAMGDPLPEVVPPGPHNPLGAYALYLALPGDYRIHGTDIDKIFGIGMQITHGCVRMYPEDIEDLYNNVPVGTPVYIVKQQFKVGWLNNKLYVEAHPDLEGEETSMEERMARVLPLMEKANNMEMPLYDQQALTEVLTHMDGVPAPVYERFPPLEEVMPTTASASAPAPAAVPAPAAAAPAPVPTGKPSPSGYYRGPQVSKPIPGSY